MNVNELKSRVYNGENLLMEVLDTLLDRKQSNDLLCAISERIPIMICEKYVGECGDGLPKGRKSRQEQEKVIV